MSIQPEEDWSKSTSFGNKDFNGQRNLYFEDNTFTNMLETAVDADAGARLVFRHNKLFDSSLVFHGGAPQDTSTYGIRQFEVYDNTFLRVSNSNAINKWIWVRGGTGVIVHNYFDQARSTDSSYLGKTGIQLSVGCNFSPNTYPLQYQVGQSSSTAGTPIYPVLIKDNYGPGTWDDRLDTASYYLGTRGNDTATQTHCSNPGDYIQYGRDYTSTSWDPINVDPWIPYAYPHWLQYFDYAPVPSGDYSTGTVSISTSGYSVYDPAYKVTWFAVIKYVIPVTNTTSSTTISDLVYKITTLAYYGTPGCASGFPSSPALLSADSGTGDGYDPYQFIESSWKAGETKNIVLKIGMCNSGASLNTTSLAGTLLYHNYTN